MLVILLVAPTHSIFRQTATDLFSWPCSMTLEVDSHEDIACVYMCTSGKTTHTSSMTTTLPIFFSRLVHGMPVRPLANRRSAMRRVFLRKMTFRSHLLSCLKDINVNGRRIFMLCQYIPCPRDKATSDHHFRCQTKEQKKKPISWETSFRPNCQRDQPRL